MNNGITTFPVDAGSTSTLSFVLLAIQIIETDCYLDGQLTATETGCSTNYNVPTPHGMLFVSLFWAISATQNQRSHILLFMLRSLHKIFYSVALKARLKLRVAVRCVSTLASSHCHNVTATTC